LVYATVHDNAANMELGCSLFSLSFRCFAHLLNLSVQYGIKVEEIKPLLVQARKLVTHFKKSVVHSEALENHQKKKTQS